MTSSPYSTGEKQVVSLIPKPFPPLVSLATPISGYPHSHATPTGLSPWPLPPCYPTHRWLPSFPGYSHLLLPSLPPLATLILKPLPLLVTLATPISGYQATPTSGCQATSTSGCPGHSHRLVTLATPTFLPYPPLVILIPRPLPSLVTLTPTSDYPHSQATPTSGYPGHSHLWLPGHSHLWFPSFPGHS